MPLDKKQIALSVVGILAGLSLTYILWHRSQQANAATAAAAAQAAANAATQEQEGQQFDAVSAGLSSSGGGGIVNNYTDSTSSPDTTSQGTSDESDISSIVNQILSSANGTIPSIPGNALIPEVDISDASTALTGIDTSAAEILGNAPAGTVSSTTSTGQTYGATSSNTAGSDSNPVAQPVTAIPIFSTGGGNPQAVSTTNSRVSAYAVQ